MYKKIKLNKEASELELQVTIIGVFRTEIRGKIYDSDKITVVESFRGNNSLPTFNKILDHPNKFYISKFLELISLFTLSETISEGDIIVTLKFEFFEDGISIKKFEDKYIPRETHPYHILLVDFTE